jgi:hypothetical protein
MDQFLRISLKFHFIFHRIIGVLQTVFGLGELIIGSLAFLLYYVGEHFKKLTGH